MSEREALREKLFEVLDETVINLKDIDYIDSTDLKKDLGLDSLGLIHLIMNLNETFNIEINSHEITVDNFSNIGQLEYFISSKLGN